MIENFIISAITGLVFGFAASVYSSVIVVRYAAFETVLNRARTIILNLDQQWQYRFLSRAIPDPDSPSGRRTVFMSRDVASNTASWQLTQVGLELKEQGHWNAAHAVDAIWLELDKLREEFLSKSHFLIDGSEQSITEYVAEWHRTLSRQKPSRGRIFSLWFRRRYEHMSCVSIDELTGMWREVEPTRDEESI
jgi:hypothetical protein